MDNFICVRLVQGNDLDLTLFQFDYDLTFAAFFMNADKTIYGRYGTRSEQKDAAKDVSITGLSKSLEGALRLHKRYPANKQFLQGKQPRKVRYKKPDDIPSLRGKYKSGINYENKVSQSCLHCHQVRDAKRLVYRNSGRPFPDELLFPYPHPNVIGLTIDSQSRATITKVVPQSAAGRGGLLSGDEIIALDGQAVLSIADIQWALHTAEESDVLPVLVRREGSTHSLTLTLPKGWRQATDITWRVSTWELRRMVTGGLVLEPLSAAQRSQRKIRTNGMALRVKHVGQYGAHAVAKQAGFKMGDVIVSFNRSAANWSPNELITRTIQSTRPGQQIPVSVLRGDKRLEMKLRMQ